MEITETSLDSVNSVVNEEVFFQSTVPHAQCAASTDVLEDQIPENASKYPIFIEIVQKCKFFFLGMVMPPLDKLGFSKMEPPGIFE